MILKDNINVQGYFAVKIFKKDGTIETYEDKNLIMDTARSNMAQLIGGHTSGTEINQFVLGNKGHNGTDILDYKKVGANSEFISSRVELFSQDPAYVAANSKDSFAYEIPFNVVGATDTVVDAAAIGNIAGGTGNALVDTCEVTRVVVDRTCTYTIVIPDTAGNPVGEGEVVAYTEAALYAGDKIFSMKTFPARVKEDTVKFEITWSIIF